MLFEQELNHKLQSGGRLWWLFYLDGLFWSRIGRCGGYFTLVVFLSVLLFHPLVLLLILNFLHHQSPASFFFLFVRPAR